MNHVLILLVIMSLTLAVMISIVADRSRHNTRALNFIGPDLLDLKSKVENEIKQLKDEIAQMKETLAATPPPPIVSSRVYSTEVRATALEYVKANIHSLPQKTMAHWLGIPRSTLSSWIRDWKRNGLIPEKEVTFTPSDELSKELDLQPAEETEE